MDVRIDEIKIRNKFQFMSKNIKKRTKSINNKLNYTHPFTTTFLPHPSLNNQGRRKQKEHFLRKIKSPKKERKKIPSIM